MSTLDRQGYASRIRQIYREAPPIELVLEIGNLLVEAKRNLSSGEFTRLTDDLPFGDRTANKFMQIVKSEVLTQITNYDTTLPKAWTTVYYLSKLPLDRLQTLIAEGVVTPNLQSAEADALSVTNGARKKPQGKKHEKTPTTALRPDPIPVESEPLVARPICVQGIPSLVSAEHTRSVIATLTSALDQARVPEQIRDELTQHRTAYLKTLVKLRRPVPVTEIIGLVHLMGLTMADLGFQMLNTGGLRKRS